MQGNHKITQKNTSTSTFQNSTYTINILCLHCALRHSYTPRHSALHPASVEWICAAPGNGCTMPILSIRRHLAIIICSSNGLGSLHVGSPSCTVPSGSGSCPPSESAHRPNSISSLNALAIYSLANSFCARCCLSSSVSLYILLSLLNPSLIHCLLPTVLRVLTLLDPLHVISDFITILILRTSSS